MPPSLPTRYGMIPDLSPIFDTDNLNSVSPTVTTGCGLQNTSRGVRSSLLYSALTGDTDLSLSLENAALTESINVEDHPASSLAPQHQPKRVRIFPGGYMLMEEYTYVRGRGRGRYMYEECGIRCKKPSILKKHIRTHTDLR